MAMSGDIVDCYNWGSTTGIWLVEAWDAAKHSKVHRTAPTTENHPAPKVSSGGIEKPCLG